MAIGNRKDCVEDAYYALAKKFLAEPTMAHYWWGLGLMLFSAAVMIGIILVYGFGVQDFFLQTGLRPANFQAIGALILGLAGLLCFPLCFGGMLMLKYGLIAKRRKIK